MGKGGKTMPANGDKTFIRDYETKKPRFNTFAFHGIFEVGLLYSLTFYKCNKSLLFQLIYFWNISYVQYHSFSAKYLPFVYLKFIGIKI